MQADVVVIGAGVAGLSAAVALRDRGRPVIVLERADGVGGRCATRRVAGQPVDHGAICIHGSDPTFLEALDTVRDATPIEGWPRRVEGRGRPCQPRAFEPGERRIAFAEGMTAWPRHLARDLDVRLGREVLALEGCDGETLRVNLDGGGQLEARDVVLALAAPQSARLLGTLRPMRPARPARALMQMMVALPCLSVIALFDEAPDPGWDVLYPEGSAVLHLVSHDSAKRAAPARRVLVIQATPAWSRGHAEQPAEQWAEAMLEEAERVIGAWAASPDVVQAHVWRYARADSGSRLSAPVVTRFDGGARIGLAGEVFGRGGGFQAAWISGREVAQMMGG